jgi:hypothetical protein
LACRCRAAAAAASSLRGLLGLSAALVAVALFPRGGIGIPTAEEEEEMDEEDGGEEETGGGGDLSMTMNEW